VCVCECKYKRNFEMEKLSVVGSVVCVCVVG